MNMSKLQARVPALFWMAVSGLVIAVGYLVDFWWLAAVGGLGFLYCMWMWRRYVPMLHLAIDNETEIECIQLILAAPQEVHATDWSGNTPLHIAARCNKPHIVQLLLLQGADVNAQNKAGSTPLHWAVGRNDYKTAKQLIEHSAEIFILNNNGETPLDRALHLGSSKMISLLTADLENDI